MSAVDGFAVDRFDAGHFRQDERDIRVKQLHVDEFVTSVRLRTAHEEPLDVVSVIQLGVGRVPATTIDGQETPFQLTRIFYGMGIRETYNKANNIYLIFK